ncbi:unnamed protein product [Adineta steineri]|uniref:Uncharacterized protein n=1 Tax=Adineta steineri TaxID=433720 RepID=A0A813SMF6_9BILA|nr:unnamed protein product [Adineta steineri]CAF3936530.1 unnamed protein product [Adineta steineri]
MLKFISLIVIILATITFAEEDANEKKEIGTVIAIDLGTSYSSVGIYKNGRVEIILNDQGSRITPSYVAFTAEGERLIGDAARNQLISNPENTVFDVKRLIGREFNDPSVQSDIKNFPFTIINRKSKPTIAINIGSERRYFEPEEISAMLIGKMREIAEAYLGYKITHAIVTVPAYFNNAQRQATKDAAAIAGLNVVRLINEPTAAAIAYSLDKREGEKHVLVFDLGGGTFDVSLIVIDNGVHEVVATNGNTHLGGKDFDERVMEHFIELFKKKTGRDVRKDNQALQKLRREVEKAKRTLSSQHQTTIEIVSFNDNKDFNEILTRTKFEDLNIDLFLSTIKSIQKVLEDADLKKKDIAEVILVGGSTRIPMIQQLVKYFFDGKEPSCDINPDEAIAYGTAVYAGVLSGVQDAGDIVFLDIYPLTMGIETDSGVMRKIIARNTVIPTHKSQVFSTAADNQAVVEIKVFEGEHRMTKYNYDLGKFDLTDIRPVPLGVPQFIVTFEINNNGILKVTAEDTEMGNTKNIINFQTNRLSPDEILRMRKDYERFAEEDKNFKYRVDAKNELELYVYILKALIADKDKSGGKLSSEEKFTIEKEIKKKIKWLDRNQATAEVNDFKTQKKFIENIVKSILTKLYPGQQSLPSSDIPSTGNEANKDEL